MASSSPTFCTCPLRSAAMWPAFWTYGANWPAGGEVDIIEGVNTMHQNTISAHTVDRCSLSSSLKAASSGTMFHTDCAVGNDNIGCGFAPAANDPSSYGDGINAVDGGVYAMQRDSKYIKVWHFARGEISGDIEAKRPDSGLWKLPDAVFGGSSCDVDSFFKGMNLVININFAVTGATPSGASRISATTLRPHAKSTWPTTRKPLPTPAGTSSTSASTSPRTATHRLVGPAQT